MKPAEKTMENWTICTDCVGIGKKKRRISKKIKLQYHNYLKIFENSEDKTSKPTPPKAHLYVCEKCKGSGLIISKEKLVPDSENFPHLAIIGAGISGIALAIACLHRKIPFTLYEKDSSFDERSQGYGLTLQQASKAIEGFGIFNLENGIVSTRHIVHTPNGKIIGEWGMRKWTNFDDRKSPNRTNIHIARQSLRSSLLNQLGGNSSVKWNHQLINFEKGDCFKLNFKVNDEIITQNADLIIGADGIRSIVRKLTIDEKEYPMQYLGCMVILGICLLKDLENIESNLLDGATVFQTANGNERIYVMPFDSKSVMWQLSFPISEKDALILSKKGTKALKNEACKRVSWHNPIPQILNNTSEDLVSGYPVYDRELLTTETLKKLGNITLIGDAAHPMSPFKGQGANQALLDALQLARTITKECRPKSDWRKSGIRASVLNQFEEEMLDRTASKVEDSAKAAHFLHSEIVLHEGDEPRGRCLKK